MCECECVRCVCVIVFGDVGARGSNLAAARIFLEIVNKDKERVRATFQCSVSFV